MSFLSSDQNLINNTLAGISMTSIAFCVTDDEEDGIQEEIECDSEDILEAQGRF